ncbi:MAG: hypothetical protein QM628_00310 [Propionicimonas sp.]
MSLPFTMPAIPADLAEIIATHKALFGGYTMTAPPPEDGAPATGTVTPPPANPATPAPPAKPADVTDEAWNTLGDPGKKALVVERQKAETERQRADALQKQIDDAKLSADEKAARDLQSAKDEGADAKSLVEKYRVAAAKGLDLLVAERLVGTTTAELEADADKLKALLGAKPGTPAADPSQGQGGGKDGAKPSGVGAGRDLYRDTHNKTDKTP